MRIDSEYMHMVIQSGIMDEPTLAVISETCDAAIDTLIAQLNSTPAAFKKRLNAYVSTNSGFLSAYPNSRKDPDSLVSINGKIPVLIVYGQDNLYHAINREKSEAYGYTQFALSYDSTENVPI